jgi:transcriptional regulator with XRE-family HTH domain
MDYYEAAFALRKAREKAGLSQEDLAQLSGFPQVNICRIENGNANVTIKTLERLAGAMGKKLRICFVDPDTPVNLDAYEVLKSYNRLEVYQPTPEFLKMHRKGPLTFDECFVEEDGKIKLVRQPRKFPDYDYLKSLPDPETLYKYPGPYTGTNNEDG